MLLAPLAVVCALATTTFQQDSVPEGLRAAQAALEAGDVEQAIDLAEHYQRRNRRDPRGYMAVGDAYALRMPSGRFRAVKAYREAHRLDRSDPEPSYKIAQIGLMIGGDDGERLANEGLERVLGLDPLYEDGWEQWLMVYRNSGGRRDMIERLEPHAAHPRVKAMIALLLIEEERYADADSVLDLALAEDSTNVAWLALRAQSVLEAGDTLRGIWYYRRALANAEHDSTDALWQQVVGIAAPEEVNAWSEGVPAEQKGAWLEGFWARRNPNLFLGVNQRIAEHFARLRVARREYPLLHPLVLYHRSELGRTLNLEPSWAERRFHLKCEVFEWAWKGSPGPGDVRYRPMMGLDDSGFPTLTGATFFPFNLDLRGIDTTAARVGYNLATGLSDRGLTYLRLGPPESYALGGDNALDPACNTTEVVRWRYDQWGELRFSKPSAFATGGERTVGEMVFRPMETPQYEAMTTALTEDHSSEPASLAFGVWMVQFRNRHRPEFSDIVVVSTIGELAGSLVSPTAGEGERRQSRQGIVTLRGSPGPSALLAHARLDTQLGRQRFGVAVRAFDSLPSVSDLVVGDLWADESVNRDRMLAHLRRDLVFASGDTVRTYAELYGLAVDAGSVWYRVSYSLLGTRNVPQDYAKEDWPDAQRFEFERLQPRSQDGITIETLDILPQWIPEGSYLLRLEVEDLVTNTPAGRATIAFEVKD